MLDTPTPDGLAYVVPTIRFSDRYECVYELGVEDYGPDEFHRL